MSFVDAAEDAIVCIKDYINSQSEEALKAEAVMQKKVLIVDDSEQVRRMFKNSLLLEGFYVTEAANGIEAAKILSRERPDLIVLDLFMEGMDGYKLLQFIRLNPDWHDIPVIVLSARGLPAEIEKAIASGIDDFLVKMSTTPKKLIEKIREVLKKRYG